MRHFNIAIDGPAGAGKSTIAKAAAKKLGFIYVDTGAMYRAMAVYFLDRGIGSQEEEKIREACNSAEITIRHEDGRQQVFLNGENVSGRIRTQEVGEMASRISVYLPVREKLVKLQQQLAKTSQVIMDGRDIGTCVLPDAQAKIYLTASTRVRAERRLKELLEKGLECSLEEIEEEIKERDYRDMHREQSPLRQAEDAVLLDTSQMDPEQVTERIIAIAKERGLEI
ncbi:MAG: (d)CMP kinase [Lachnospiraceae bacterium]|nr:(d)CMP kinase [Lachnospiraceae bacterium]